MDENE
jgi:hypothetical protein